MKPALDGGERWAALNYSKTISFYFIFIHKIPACMQSQ